MRIIAGKAKGRRLKTVPGMKVRPTTDRVRESLFQIIGPYFEGGSVLDLFAGSGSLGLETLSRGAERAVFVDHSPASVETVRKNLQVAGFADRAEVYRRDARAALRILARRKLSFRYIFLDPPYRETFLPELLTYISEHGLLEPRGVLMAEHGSASRLQPRYNHLSRVRELVYGQTVIHLYQREDPGGAKDAGGSLSGEL
ncbi:16S rRNA (guanine(966)-N(2))-methyltransferase RsmD [Kroppenstedtia eburnea]|uniref:16S rRNA (Guanine(966)-N(2))-methyltransferase RsmD n=1 Tax=Kroppenstedtia eburnea TaxID=714067 RepID=A0A1N7J1R6_9BACL|nr:16S rRNA (guanine(966)-N(2))-methyltransferase RsmD [Kroppenstedtia eburnea]EGK13486.1 ribosomal RNA small subunit methyltransferase D [Desmospora sp. 8437]QKI83752.1 16S rRNA (guanine(966)-N(2))-methyltransferase RsmD [Kroppenstedtia eburnea]SIS43161.1 16S rRNA (guanine(966)-N(2))-methyltransferase RsmD [Kroppenstedtia eburnea]